VGVLAGGQSVEGGVRPVGVVLHSPSLDQHLGFGERAELLDVEQFVADPAVERLDVGFSRGAGSI